MTTYTLDEVEELLRKHMTANALFSNADRRGLIMSTHPDRNIGDPRAAKLFKQIEELELMSAGPAVTIKTKKHVYTLKTRIAAGDVADIFDAGPYVVKVSRIPGGNELLECERESLTTLITAAGDAIWRKYLPTMVESFAARDKIDKRVNVFMNEDAFYTLEQVHDKYPLLDPRHVGWIYKRLLSILGFVHSQKIVHGAILPCHIRINPKDHGLQLFGWGQSVPVGKQVSVVSKKYKGFYPPEIFDKKPVGPETDIYMAAKCMLWLSNQIPPKIESFIRSSILAGMKMRPDDAWTLQDELTVLLKGQYGKPRFVSLTM